MGAATALLLTACAPSAQTADPTPIPSEAPAPVSSSPSPSIAALDDRPLDQQLFEAVRAGDVALAGLALAAGQTPDFTIEDTTPLAVACGRDDVEMAQLLIESGASVVSDQGDHIFAAAQSSGPDIIELLLANGSSVVGPEGEEGSVLATAAFWGNVPAMRVLIAAGAPIAGPVMRAGDTYSVIGTAAYGGHVEAVQLLVESGADPYTPGPDGGLPSEWATTGGHDDVVAYLASIGA